MVLTYVDPDKVNKAFIFLPGKIKAFSTLLRNGYFP